MYAKDIRVTIILLVTKSKGQHLQITMLGEVGMANESTKPLKQVCGWLNTMNDQGCSILL